jgi:hypothetical protein
MHLGGAPSGAPRAKRMGAKVLHWGGVPKGKAAREVRQAALASAAALLAGLAWMRIP